jgi:hypothetical protein
MFRRMPEVPIEPTARSLVEGPDPAAPHRTDGFETLTSVLKCYSEPIGRAVLRYSAAKPHAWSLFVVLVAIVIALFSRFPAYSDADAPYPGSLVSFVRTPYGHAIAWWLDHPFREVPTREFFPPASLDNLWIAGSVSHCDKLTFRAFLPLLNQVTAGGLWTLVVANHVAAILIFLLVYRVCLRLAVDTVISTAVTWAFAASWAGSCGFNDFVNGDAVAMALLLGAMVTRTSWVVAVCLFAAGFTDERALCVAPLIALCRYWEWRRPFEATGAVMDFQRLRTVAAPLLFGVSAYLVCRLAVSAEYHLTTGTSTMGRLRIPVFHFYINFPGTLFKVFEFLWVYPVLLLLALVAFRKTHLSDLVAYTFGLLLAAAPAFLVWDFDRSIYYLTPGVLASACFGFGQPTERRGVALAVCAMNLICLSPLESWLRIFLN